MSSTNRKRLARALQSAMPDLSYQQALAVAAEALKANRTESARANPSGGPPVVDGVLISNTYSMIDRDALRGVADTMIENSRTWAGLGLWLVKGGTPEDRVRLTADLYMLIPDSRTLQLLVGAPDSNIWALELILGEIRGRDRRRIRILPYPTEGFSVEKFDGGERDWKTLFERQCSVGIVNLGDDGAVTVHMNTEPVD